MIRYTAKALRDFIQAEVSNDYLRAVRETCLRIEQFQGLGHPVAGNPGIHVYRHAQHKIYYAIEPSVAEIATLRVSELVAVGDDVVIVRFLHERRRVPKRLR